MFTVWSDHNKVAGTFNAIPTLLLPTLQDLFLRQNIDVGGIDKWPLWAILNTHLCWQYSTLNTQCSILTFAGHRLDTGGRWCTAVFDGG